MSDVGLIVLTVVETVQCVILIVLVARRSGGGEDSTMQAIIGLLKGRGDE